MPGLQIFKAEAFAPAALFMKMILLTLIKKSLKQKWILGFRPIIPTLQIKIQCKISFLSLSNRSWGWKKPIINPHVHQIENCPLFWQFFFQCHSQH
jgi:hypothetical protein